jgi:hypothetical protein
VGYSLVFALSAMHLLHFDRYWLVNWISFPGPLMGGFNPSDLVCLTTALIYFYLWMVFLIYTSFIHFLNTLSTVLSFGNGTNWTLKMAFYSFCLANLRGWVIWVLSIFFEFPFSIICFLQEFDPVKYILDNIPTEDGDAAYFDKQVWRANNYKNMSFVLDRHCLFSSKNSFHFCLIQCLLSWTSLWYFCSQLLD